MRPVCRKGCIASLGCAICAHSSLPITQTCVFHESSISGTMTETRPRKGTRRRRCAEWYWLRPAPADVEPGTEMAWSSLPTGSTGPPSGEAGSARLSQRQPGSMTRLPRVRPSLERQPRLWCCSSCTRVADSQARCPRMPSNRQFLSAGQSRVARQEARPPLMRPPAPRTRGGNS